MLVEPSPHIVQVVQMALGLDERLSAVTRMFRSDARPVFLEKAEVRLESPKGVIDLRFLPGRVLRVPITQSINRQ